MGVFDLFSKRQKQLSGEVPDVYTYDEIPQPLRVQIVHIWSDALGNVNDYHGRYNSVFNSYKLIVEVLCREYGLFRLPAPRDMATGITSLNSQTLCFKKKRLKGFLMLLSCHFGLSIDPRGTTIT